MAKQNNQVIKVWQFARYEYYSPRYELHEIRENETKGTFELVVNIYNTNGDGYAFPDKFYTFGEAKEALNRFRPGSRLISEPAK